MDSSPPPPDPVPGPSLSSKRRRVSRFVEGLFVPEGMDVDVVAAIPRAMRVDAIRDHLRLMANPVTGQVENVHPLKVRESNEVRLKKLFKRAMDTSSEEEDEESSVGPKEGNEIIPPPPPDPVPGPSGFSEGGLISRYVEGLLVSGGMDVDVVAALTKAMREEVVRDQLRMLAIPVTGQEENVHPLKARESNDARLKKIFKSVMDTSSDQKNEESSLVGPKEGNESKSPYIILDRGDMEEGETLEEYLERKRALDMGSTEEVMDTSDNPTQGPSNSFPQSEEQLAKDELEEAIKEFLSVSYTASPIPQPEDDGDGDDDDAQPIKRFENLWKSGTPPTPTPKVIPPWTQPPDNTNERHIFQTIIRKILDMDRETRGKDWDESRDGPLEKWEEHSGYQKIIRNRRNSTNANPHNDTIDKEFKLRIPPAKKDASNKKKGGQGEKTPVQIMRVHIRNDFKEHPFRIYFFSQNWSDREVPVGLCVSQPGIKGRWMKCRHPNCTGFSASSTVFCKIHSELKYIGTAVILRQAQEQQIQQPLIMACATVQKNGHRTSVTSSWFKHGDTFMQYLSQKGLVLKDFKTLGFWTEEVHSATESNIRDSIKLGFCILNMLNNIKKGGPEGMIILPHDCLQIKHPDRKIVLKFLADNNVILSVGDKSRYGSTAQPPYSINDQIRCPSGYNGFGYPGQKYVGKNATVKQAMDAGSISFSHNKRTSLQKANCMEDSSGNAGFKIYQPQLSKKDERVLAGMKTEVVSTQEQEELWMKLRYDVEMAESVGQCADWICWLLEETFDGYPIQLLNKRFDLGFSHPKTQFLNILSKKFIPFIYGPKHQEMLETFVAYNIGKDFTFQFPENWDPSTINFSEIEKVLKE